MMIVLHLIFVGVFSLAAWDHMFFSIHPNSPTTWEDMFGTFEINIEESPIRVLG